MSYAYPGQADVERDIDSIAIRLPPPLASLARVAVSFRWSWTPGAAELFNEIDPHRWELSGMSPYRFLQDVGLAVLERAAADDGIVERLARLAGTVAADLARPPASTGVAPEHPVAFFCAEFGVHASLPLYAGGLGGLAGDVLKEASDRALPMVGVGLMYRQGYFHQLLDTTGLQHEYWIDTDPERLAAVRVTGSDEKPLVVSIPVWGREVRAQIWRVDVGRVPLYLLDTQLPENTVIDRWITARLYDGNPSVRLAQYCVLGVGGVRALAALGIDPGVVHLNEGHAALAVLELAAREVAGGADFKSACERARRRVVFTTHTPVAAGNEMYAPADILSVMPDFPARLGTDTEGLLRLGRIHPDSPLEPSGMTPLAIRMSRSVNGVSKRHGTTARGMWKELFPGTAVDKVPIFHITNGVHLPTWLSPALGRLLDRHLAPGWRERAAEPATWDAVEGIPDEELWAQRMAARRRLVELVRLKGVADRLRRGESIDYVQAPAHFDPEVLTLGFARRLAEYKRLHLLTHDPARALRLLEKPRPVQLFFAGKAHPRDEGAKRIVQTMFALKSAQNVAGHVAFLEDHDLALGAELVAGCDVWINLPRPPLEASGTSGMKAGLNGCLNLSVLDGWWMEAYDGENGWAINGDVDPDDAAKDARDAAALYDLLEDQVLPLFYERGADGIPHGWVTKMKASLRTIAPRFSTTRMLDEYVHKVYEQP